MTNAANQIQQSIDIAERRIHALEQLIREKPSSFDLDHYKQKLTETETVLAQLKTVPHRKLHFVLGMVNDKDITEILSLLPKDASYYFCQANIPRAMEANVLARMAAKAGCKGVTIPGVNEALAAAQENAVHDDLVFVGGSTFVVAEIEGL